MKPVVRCLALLSLLAANSAHGLLYSIDAASPSAALVSPADILSPGPVGGPPLVAIPFGPAGLKLTAGDDVNAIAYAVHVEPFPPTFSVDRFAAGAPGTAVAFQAVLSQAAGDVFLAPAPGSNVLLVNQSVLGLLPAIGPSVPGAPPIDNVDALEMIHPAIPTPAGLFYTLTPGSPSLVTIGATAGDILTTGPSGPVIAISFAALGLMPADVVDALLLTPGPPIFSLAPGSPGLTFPIGPGDLLAAGVPPTVVAPAGALALMLPGPSFIPPGDNVDAISAIPEAKANVLMLTGVLIVALAARKRRAKADKGIVTFQGKKIPVGGAG